MRVFDEAIDVSREAARTIHFAAESCRRAHETLAALHVVTSYDSSFGVTEFGLRHHAGEARKALTLALRLLDQAEEIQRAHRAIDEDATEPSIDDTDAPLLTDDARQVEHDYARAAGAPR